MGFINDSILSAGWYRIPKSEFEASPLSLADAETIYNNSEYKEALSIDYIKDRITNGSSVGLYEKDQLVAWGMTQDDGGMGFLHVLPECRRKKYGYNITLLWFIRKSRTSHK